MGDCPGRSGPRKSVAYNHSADFHFRDGKGCLDSTLAQEAQPRDGRTQPPDQPLSRTGRHIASDRTEDLLCTELAVFQAAPLAWRDGDDELHAIGLLDFDRETEVLGEALADAASIGGAHVGMTVDVATVDRLGAFLATAGVAGGKPRALHFSCHGAPDYLVLEDGAGGAQFLGVDDLNEFVSAGNGGGILFVFVSACHSHAAGEAFLAAGARHVVCCRRDEPLMDAATIEFGRNFYLSLCCGRTLRDAFQIARQSVKLSPNLPSGGNEMAKFILLPDDADHGVSIFPPKCGAQHGKAPRPTAKAAAAPIIPQPPQRLIGRDIDMYRAIQSLKKSRLVRVTGPPGSGKCSFAASLSFYVSKRGRSFSTDEIIWVPPLHSGESELSASFQLLFDNIMSCGTEFDLNSTCLAIAKSLNEKKALIVIDAKPLSDEGHNRLSIFLRTLYQGSKHCKAVVISRKESSPSSMGTCVESDVVLPPLKFCDSASLFGMLCSYVSEGRCAIARTPGQFSTLLESGMGDEKFRSFRKAIVLRMLGGGLPTNIRDAARQCSEEDFDRLISFVRKGPNESSCVDVSSRVHLEHQLIAAERRRQDAISAQEYSEAERIQMELDELKRCREAFPGINKLLGTMRKLEREKERVVAANDFASAKRLKVRMNDLRGKIMQEENDLAELSEGESRRIQNAIMESDRHHKALSAGKKLARCFREIRSGAENLSCRRLVFAVTSIVLLGLATRMSLFVSISSKGDIGLFYAANMLEDTPSFYNPLVLPGRPIVGIESAECLANTPLSPPSNLPAPLKLIGRNEELKALADILGASGQMASLIGGAGFGKSHCAKTFAREWYGGANNRWGWWLPAETETQLRLGYIQILEAHWQSVDERLTTADLARAVWMKLCSFQFEWILVFDNVPEVSPTGEGGPEYLKSMFFPLPLERWSRGRILFTSRSSQFSGDTCLGQIAKVTIGPLSESSAVDMLISNVPHEEYEDKEVAAMIQGIEKEAATLLAKSVQYLPLAIATISGHIQDRCMTVKNYLKEFQIDEVSDSINLALRGALDYARNQGLDDILDIAAFLYPDTMHSYLLGEEETKINRLCEMSLLRRVRPGVYSIHRLHQKVLREKSTSERAIVSLKRTLMEFDSNNPEHWQLGRDVLPHIQAIDKHTENINDEKALVSYASDILSAGGDILRVIVQDFDKSHVMYTKALTILDSAFGINAINVDSARVLTSFGSLSCSQGDYRNALEMLSEALARFRHIYGSDAENMDIVRALNQIGVVNRKLANYDAAEAIFEDSLKMQRNIFGRGAMNAELARTLTNLGSVFANQSPEDYELAGAMYEESLNMLLSVYDSNQANVEVAAILNNLGFVYRKQGMYEEAEEKIEKALEMLRHAYGPEARNNDLVRTLMNLGILRLNRKDYPGAEDSFRSALAMKKHVLGSSAPDHPDVKFLDWSLADLNRRKAGQLWK